MSRKHLLINTKSSLGSVSGPSGALLVVGDAPAAQPEPLLKGALTKKGTLTSSKQYYILDAQSLTWWADAKQASPLAEVDAKHRLTLADVAGVAVKETKSGCDFEVSSADKARSFVLHAKEKTRRASMQQPSSMLQQLWQD